MQRTTFGYFYLFALKIIWVQSKYVNSQMNLFLLHLKFNLHLLEVILNIYITKCLLSIYLYELL